MKISFEQNRDKTVIAAYDQIVFHILEAQNLHGYKTFLFCGCEPQVGTTSVVKELGILLARLSKRVLIVEGDYRRASSCGDLPGMSDYIFRPDAALADCICQSNVEGLCVLPSGETAGRDVGQILYSPRFRDALEQLKEQFDLILVDSGAVDTTNDVLPLAALSDAAALVCALNGSPKSKLRKAYRKLAETRCDMIGVIENMVDMREYKSYMNHYDYYTSPSDAAEELPLP